MGYLVPRSWARATTTGMPLSTQVTSMPPMVSQAWPVGGAVRSPIRPCQRTAPAPEMLGQAHPRSLCPRCIRDTAGSGEGRSDDTGGVEHANACGRGLDAGCDCSRSTAKGPAGRHGRRGRRDGERGEPEAIEAAGLSFILGMKIPHVRDVVAQWRREHPGEQIPDGHIFTQPCPPGQTAAAGTR